MTSPTKVNSGSSRPVTSYLVKNAESRDVERAQLNRILAQIDSRLTLNEEEIAGIDTGGGGGSGSGTTYVFNSTQFTTTGTSTKNVSVSAGGIGNTELASSAVTNAKVASAAAIALDKLAATTASRAVVTDGSGFVSAATTTATEIGYVNGVTSAIQTQLNAKADDSAVVHIAGTETITGAKTFSSDVALSATDAKIIANTSDASDTNSVSLCGGGSNIPLRGAYVRAYGNEASSPGDLVLSSGNVAGASVSLLSNDTITTNNNFAVSGNHSCTGNATLGSGTGGSAKTTVGGYGLSGFGQYGLLELSASSAYTGSARRWLITNAYNANTLALIRSVDANTSPTLSGTGTITSGTLDLSIDNAGLVTAHNGLAVTGEISTTGSIGVNTTSPSIVWSGAAKVLHVKATSTDAAGVRAESANGSLELFSSGGSSEMGLYSASNIEFSMYRNAAKFFSHTGTTSAFTGAISATTTVATGVYTVATLPAGTTGQRAFVTDANATTFASVVAGGGANGVPVYYDSANWRIG